MAGNKTQGVRSGASLPGFADGAPRPGKIILEYSIPNEPDGDNLWAETTEKFGSIRAIGLTHLTPLQERHAALAAKGESILLAFELARRSVIEVTNSDGDVFRVSEHDGSNSELWAQMHPKLRNLVMNAYADQTSTTESATQSFLKSRTIKV